ncbi:MAG: serine/threonine-protein kinase [Phycisphaerae bacterium]|nr:serine/threonine-protein kinase [Phycisphaerae bacterium]
MSPSAIGPYQILRELGRGGMGEVFLAIDSRLDRHVAIKALPAHLAHDPDRLARFQREAKVLASLNHPGIAAIYGLEEVGGHIYLILEFVEGETLAKRLERGALPVGEALALAKQMSEALEAAHEKGIVHRDLKPGNIMLPPDGPAKVLDFGLARTEEPAGPPGSRGVAPDSPTLVTPGPVHSPTIPGVMLGTAGYMSPEQARGKPVDKRSDIFSFGCVVYEMLTGVRPFDGDSLADVIGATLHREIDLELLPAETPRRARELIANCLVKDRKNRLHDIGDARLELERAMRGGNDEHGPPASAAPARSRASTGRIALASGLVALVAAGAGWLLARSTATAPSLAPAPTFHLSAMLQPDLGFSELVGIAPDARFVLYRAWPNVDPDSEKPYGILAIRRLDRAETVVLEGTEGVLQAALSPDGRSIAFAATKDRQRTKITLQKMSLADGRPSSKPEPLCDLPPVDTLQMCWSSDREIVVSLDWQETILVVSATTGDSRTLLKAEKPNAIDAWTDIRPNVPGRSIFATRWSLVGSSISERAEIIDLATGARTPFIANAGMMQRVDDTLVIGRRLKSGLIAARVDPTSMRIEGDPVTIWSGRTRSPFFVARNGTVAFTAENEDSNGRTLQWVGDDGELAPVPTPARAFSLARTSPDGSRIVATLEPAENDDLSSTMFVLDLARGSTVRISMDAPILNMVWSADGAWLTYGSIEGERFSIWNRRADGTGEPTKIYDAERPGRLVVPLQWSAAGDRLAIAEIEVDSANASLSLLTRDPSGGAWRVRPLAVPIANGGDIRFSPDGTWILFASDVSGRRELYAQPIESTSGAGRVQVSTNGAPSTFWWSPDGTEIRYIRFDDDVMSVKVRLEPTIAFERPTVRASIKGIQTRTSEFAPDGRLLIVKSAATDRVTRIDVLVNVAEEIRTLLSPRELRR